MKKSLCLLAASLLLSSISFASPGHLENGDWGELCSGFFINSKGYIVTAGHCYSGKDPLYVQYDNKEYKAEVLWVSDPTKHDSMLLHIDVTGNPYLSIQPRINTLETAFTVGYPEPNTVGYNLKIYNETVIDLNGLDGDDEITLAGAAYPGNSGGPVVNQNNEVIGILTSGLPGAPLEFSKKIQYVREILELNNIPYTIKTFHFRESMYEIYNNNLNTVVLVYTHLDLKYKHLHKHLHNKHLDKHKRK